MYQNNNNRVVPQEQKDIKLDPQAAVVDKQLKYNFDMSKYSAANDIGNGLIKFGEGIVNLDPVLQIMADKAIGAAKTQLDSNEKEWADYSRKVTGAAKFNPYLKDAYQRSIAKDMANAALLKLVSKEEIEKMTPEEFQLFKNNTTQEMFNALEQANMKPKNFEKVLLNYNDEITKLENNYTIKHAEYVDKKYAIQKIYDIKEALGLSMFNLGAEEYKNEALNGVLNEELDELHDLGKSDEYQLAVLTDGLTGFFSDNPEKMTFTDLTELINTIKINDKPLKEINPKIAYELHQKLREAKQSDLSDRKFEYDSRTLTYNENLREATRELSLELKNNPDLYYKPEELLQKHQELVEKYDLYDNPDNLLNQIVQNKSLITRLLKQETDETKATELAIKHALGELDYDDLKEALMDGSLGYKDYFSFADRLTREDKAEQAAIEKLGKETKTNIDKAVKDFINDYTKKSGAFADHADNLKAQQDILMLQEQAQNGQITADEFYKRLSLMKKAIKAEQEKSKLYNTVSESMVNNARLKLTDDDWGSVNLDNDLKAFKKMRLTKQTVKIISPPSKSRNGRSHYGYDLNCKLNDPVYFPSNGKVVYSGYNGSAGYMLIVQDTRSGNYIKYMHLKKGSLLPKGSTVDKNTVIARVGNTGYVEDPSVGSLHTEFYNKFKMWISAERFFKRYD